MFLISTILFCLGFVFQCVVGFIELLAIMFMLAVTSSRETKCRRIEWYIELLLLGLSWTHVDLSWAS